MSSAAPNGSAYSSPRISLHTPELACWGSSPFLFMEELKEAQGTHGSNYTAPQTPLPVPRPPRLPLQQSQLGHCSAWILLVWGQEALGDQQPVLT